MVVSPSVLVEVTGGRGKSFSDIARATGAFGTQPSDNDSQVLDNFADFAIQENPGFQSQIPGPADNTYFTLASFKASDISQKKASLVGVSGIPSGEFFWETANAPYTADNINVIKADSTSLSVGAWVRQNSNSLTFLQAGAGAILRDAKSKLQEIVSVSDYGAIGSANDTPLMDKALAAANTVLVPVGQTNLKEGDIPSNRTIRGYGPGSVLKLASGGFRLFSVNGKSNIVLENLTLDAGGSAINAALFTTCTRVVVRDCWITGSSSNTLQFDNCTDCTVESPEVYSTGGASSSAAIYFTNATAGSGSRRNRVINPVFHSTVIGRGVFALGQQGFYVSPSGKMTNGELVLLEDSTDVVVNLGYDIGSEPSAASLADGVAVNGGCARVSINGGVLSHTSGHGISVNGQSGKAAAKDVTISGVVIDSPDEGGIVVTDQNVPGSMPKGVRVTGCIVRNAGQQRLINPAIGGEAFGVAGGTDCRFSNCRSYDDQGTPTTTYGFLEGNGNVSNASARNRFDGDLDGGYAMGVYDIVAPTTWVKTGNDQFTETWVIFDGTVNPPAILAKSNNINTVVRNSTGNYSIIFLNDLPSSGGKGLYPVALSAKFSGGANLMDADAFPAAGSITVQTFVPGGTANNSDWVSVKCGS